MSNEKDVQNLNTPPISILTLVERGDLLYWALTNRQCTCTYNVPYEGGHVPRVMVEKCHMHKALEAWENLTGDPQLRREHESYN